MEEARGWESEDAEVVSYCFPLIPLKKAGLAGQRKTIITSLMAAQPSYPN